eukprot:CAMPEP_0181184052 /NCGR_PEP_ID=MMETSP1096-20121128/8758_1 /TAXON_ID=156174 ORGANISM="Chrysochromulina ericina, Strain CCMP281" /NCGR_SAMPLE_ID=MMETSP1096 /ASSEMBLY_ACC=CAM_ASM_000453 /LENGTH=271 /DNA_ID=CAMNT_0023272783 /DNA_START=1446 /DNA_END=2261 /DNA_ORIENTATION=+
MLTDHPPPQRRRDAPPLPPGQLSHRQAAPHGPSSCRAQLRAAPSSLPTSCSSSAIEDGAKSAPAERDSALSADGAAARSALQPSRASFKSQQHVGRGAALEVSDQELKLLIEPSPHPGSGAALVASALRRAAGPESSLIHAAAFGSAPDAAGALAGGGSLAGSVWGAVTGATPAGGLTTAAGAGAAATGAAGVRLVGGGAAAFVVGCGGGAPPQASCKAATQRAASSAEAALNLRAAVFPWGRIWKIASALEKVAPARFTVPLTVLLLSSA